MCSFFLNSRYLSRDRWQNILSKTLIHGLLKRKFDHVPRPPHRIDFLTEDAFMILDPSAWVDSEITAKAMAPAKMFHHLIISDTVHFTHRPNRWIHNRVNPLICQPIVEAYLVAPIYELVPGELTAASLAIYSRVSLREPYITVRKRFSWRLCYPHVRAERDFDQRNSLGWNII